MANQLNTYSDISSIAQAVQVDANFILREETFITRLITNFADLRGGNDRTRYDYNNVTVNEVGESDDLTSQSFLPSAGETLTPIEDAAQIFITDKRARSEAPESILNDSGMELGMAMADKLSQNIYGKFSSLTGGTVGTAGSTLTWGNFAAAASQARVAVKSLSMPLVAVLHEYQWFDLGKASSIAGATLAQAPRVTDEITINWYRGTIFGVDIFVSPALPIDTSDDVTGAIFAPQALAYDLRDPIRVRPERDESRRGLELNGMHNYAYGVWRPTFGVQIISDAVVPTG